VGNGFDLHLLLGHGPRERLSSSPLPAAVEDDEGVCDDDQVSIFLVSFSSSFSAFPFSDISYWVHHPFNRDDRQLRAHAMASDFSVVWQ
jgi:hypothetical protein